MAQQLSSFPVGTPIEEIVATIARDGGAIANDFLSPDTIDELVRDMTPHLEAVDWCNTDDDQLGDKFFGFRTKRLHGLPRKICAGRRHPGSPDPPWNE